MSPLNETKGMLNILKERGASPVLSTFFVSWIIINWDIFYYLIFTKMGTSEIIQKVIDDINVNYLNFEIHYFNLLIAPLCVTIFYLYAFPFISGWLEGWREWVLKWKHAHLSKRKALDYDALMKNFNDISSKYNKALDEKMRIEITFVENIKRMREKIKAAGSISYDHRQITELLRDNFDFYYIAADVICNFPNFRTDFSRL